MILELLNAVNTVVLFRPPFIYIRKIVAISLFRITFIQNVQVCLKGFRTRKYIT